MIRNEKMRDALKELESTVTATLAHQPEDDEKCGQFLYDALVKVYNIADLACHGARDKCAAPAVNGAKLREALEAAKNFVDNVGKAALSDNIDAITICQCAAKLSGRIEAALAEPARNCDVYTSDELKVIFNSELVLELPIANEHEKNLVTITAMGVIDTLFAKATEGGIVDDRRADNPGKDNENADDARK